MRAIVSVIGKDRVGIIASVCTLLSEKNVNILDISQTILDSFFTMTMLVDVTNSTVAFAELAEILKSLGKGMGLEIRIQHEAIFESMHRI